MSQFFRMFAIASLAAVACGLAAGCTTSHAIAVSQDEFILSVQSHNSLNGQNYMVEKTIREAAKKTLGSGFRYFEILSATGSSRNFSMVVPGSAQTTGSVSTFGNNAVYNQYTTYSPPMQSSFQWLGDQVRVKMFPEGAPEARQRGVLDAKLVLSR